MRKMAISTILAASAVIGSTVAVAQANTGVRLTATLDGASEVPGPGDSDGTGTATVRINPGQNQLCYSITVRNIAPATMAHIHEAPAGKSGPVKVTLRAPTTGTSQSCVAITRDLAKEIVRSPSDYYVNVHNAEFGSGAVRGQLGR